MENGLHVYLARLLANARQKKGFKTIKEIYQRFKPSVDYQTWSCAESGRRLPHPNSLLEMAGILEIPKQELIIAHAKDKFQDEECHKILDAMPMGELVSMDSLLEAIDYASRQDFVLSSTQLGEMKKDIRLRLFLLYTYDENYKTSITRLCNYFSCDETEALTIVKKLESLGLVEIIGEEIKRNHKFTSIPSTKEFFDMRKELLLKTLELNIKPDSYFTNCHLTLSEAAFKKIMDFLHFSRANFIRLEKEAGKEKKSKYQIALVANMISEGNQNVGSE